jgi:transposase
MAVETSLSKLQNELIKLEKENLKLRDSLAVQKEKKNSLQKSLKNIEKNLESKIDKAVKKKFNDLLLENEKLKEENEKLKRILNHDSNNSGIPTSKTKIGSEKRIPNSREKSELKKGGQIGHKKHKLERFNDNEITDTYTYTIANKNCKSCGGKLKLTGKRYKDDFDIEIRLIKRRNEFCEYTCECCGKEIKAPIPNNLKEDNQYGPNVQTMALSLLNEGYVSFKRVRELINGFSGGEMTMSEGYIAKLQKRCYEKLSNFDNSLHQALLKQKLIQWDDTSISINGKQSCLRFYGNDKLKYYKAHERKDKAGLDEDEILNILDKDTVVVHDHNKVNYNDDYNFTNAECCVHLIRNLKELNEVLQRKWITDLITLLINTNNKRKDYINKSILQFDAEVVDNVIKEYDDIIKEAKKINSKDFNKYYGKEEKTMIKRLTEYKENYLLWVTRFDIPFSNNLSERSLRSSKTKMKVSGGFANIKNAEYFARIKSYIETCKCNNLNPHIAFTKLINDNPYTLEDMKID